MNKLDVRAQVLTCTNCDLHKTCKAPVPFSGQIPSQTAILGEAPGASEDEAGQPFVGKAGNLLRASMLNAGLNPAGFTFINTVSCFPTTDGKGRRPMLAEMKACAKNREDQLAVADSRWVILTGNVPLQAYRPDLRIGRVHGQVMKRPGTDQVFFPIYHPAAILRNRSWTSDFEADLSLFKTVLERDSWEWVPFRCVTCSVSQDEMEGVQLDDWGVATCDRCWSETH